MSEENTNLDIDDPSMECAEEAMPAPSPDKTARKKKAIGTKHFLETYFTSIMLHGCTLAQGVILARMLGADGRGDYAAVILWPNIIANVGLMGSRLAITRAAADSTRDMGNVARAGLLISLILSGMSVIVGILLLPLLMPESNNDIMGMARIFMVIFVPAFILSANMAGVDHGQGRFRRLNFFRLIQSPMNVLLLLAIIVLKQGNLKFCLYATLVSFWLTTLGRFILLTHQVSLFGSVASLIKLFKEGIPYAVTGIFGQLTHRGDRILLLWLLTDRDLGLYAVAFSAASLMAEVPKAMGFVSLAIAAQEEPRKGFSRAAQIFRGATILSVAMGIGLMVAIYLLLPVIYGKEYASARMIGVILAFGFVPFGLRTILSGTLTGQGKPLAGMFSRVAGMGVMVLVSFLTRRSLGANGVALGFFASEVVSLIGMIIFILRHYHSSSLGELVPTISDARLMIRRIWQYVADMLKKFKRVFSRNVGVASGSENQAE